MPEQGLWRSNYEGFAKVPVNLPAKDVEVVCRGGAVHHLHVSLLDLFAIGLIHHGYRVLAVIHLLQESLYAAAGVLGTHTLHAMRQQKD